MILAIGNEWFGFECFIALARTKQADLRKYTISAKNRQSIVTPGACSSTDGLRRTPEALECPETPLLHHNYASHVTRERRYELSECRDGVRLEDIGLP
jgi:hypothetical protein